MVEKKFRARVVKFGTNIRSEQILPVRYCTLTRPEELAPHVMEGADPTVASRIKKGDVILAGANFGCGGSLEAAPLAIKSAGVAGVIAESFARIFYRNAINIGLPILEAVGVWPGCADGDMLEVDLDRGLIRNITKMRTFQSTPFTDFMQTLMQLGGLEEYVRQRLRRAKVR